MEGENDIQFLTRIGKLLHSQRPDLPNLERLVAQEQVLWIPFGGGDSRPWTTRLAGLRLAEFHLYDREAGPTSAGRLRSADLVNARLRCRAFVTRGRSLESYLHPDAILEARGVRIAFSPADDVAELAAAKIFEGNGKAMPWQGLPTRTRKRLRNRAKRWLSREAVERMTAARLQQQDPHGEVTLWFESLAYLLDESRWLFDLPTLEGLSGALG